MQERQAGRQDFNQGSGDKDGEVKMFLKHILEAEHPRFQLECGMCGDKDGEVKMFLKHILDFSPLSDILFVNILGYNHI